MTETKPTTDAERFRAFAQKIVSVPKAEVDRRAKALEKAKAKRSKATA